MAVEERTPRRPLFFRWVDGFVALVAATKAYQCLESYLHGAPSPSGKSGVGAEIWFSHLHTSPEQALFLAVVLGLLALVFAYSALRSVPLRLTGRLAFLQARRTRRLGMAATSVAFLVMAWLFAYPDDMEAVTVGTLCALIAAYRVVRPPRAWDAA